MHTSKFACDREKKPPFVDDLFLIKPVALSDFKVCCVVPWGYRHYPCPELHVNHFILDHRGKHRTIDPFHFDFLSVFVRFIALIFRVHHHILVSELGFGSRGSNNERSVLEIIEICFFLSPLDLII